MVCQVGVVLDAPMVVAPMVVLPAPKVVLEEMLPQEAAVVHLEAPMVHLEAPRVHLQAAMVLLAAPMVLVEAPMVPVATPMVRPVAAARHTNAGALLVVPSPAVVPSLVESAMQTLVCQLEPPWLWCEVWQLASPLAPQSHGIPRSPPHCGGCTLGWVLWGRRSGCRPPWRQSNWKNWVAPMLRVKACKEACCT